MDTQLHNIQHRNTLGCPIIFYISAAGHGTSVPQPLVDLVELQG